MLSHSFEIDQDQRLAQYEAIEEIYLSGITDAADGRFPAMSEICYLQGYRQGMVDFPRREVVLPIIDTDAKEYPLLCSQCYYFKNDICSLKSISRNSNSYACDHVVVDSPF